MSSSLELKEITLGADDVSNGTTETLWYSPFSTLHFSYDHDAHELWDEVNDPHGMPIAAPSTLTEARAIIEKQGHTIT